MSKVIYIDGRFKQITQGINWEDLEKALEKVSSLKSASVVDNKLILTFNTSNGDKTVEVDLSQFVDIYQAGNGISIQDNIISLIQQYATLQELNDHNTNEDSHSDIRELIQQVSNNKLTATVEGETLVLQPVQLYLNNYKIL